MTGSARLAGMTVHRTDDGTPGYRVDNAFGQSIQVLPRPPGFRATIVLEWEGATPDDVAAFVDRARAAGITIGD